LLRQPLLSLLALALKESITGQRESTRDEVNRRTILNKQRRVQQVNTMIGHDYCVNWFSNTLFIIFL
jgi:hypothetical protein